MFAGRRSRRGAARVARVVRACLRAGQERVCYTGWPELRRRHGLGHQLHSCLRVDFRAGYRQARQQPDTALSRWRGGKCILIICYIINLCIFIYTRREAFRGATGTELQTS